ncbi:unnamed protein product [Pleuronectes platessa]|uniref:Uncharacterized protein n=1 Tax=Pleuronectes platessa TaxID=8262 RepID=A0A9N7V0V2_PLEPL|nr:unnamed protein product [Pleuronectes platessa]
MDVDSGGGKVKPIGEEPGNCILTNDQERATLLGAETKSNESSELLCRGPRFLNPSQDEAQQLQSSLIRWMDDFRVSAVLSSLEPPASPPPSLAICRAGPEMLWRHEQPDGRN